MRVGYSWPDQGRAVSCPRCFTLAHQLIGHLEAGFAERRGHRWGPGSRAAAAIRKDNPLRQRPAPQFAWSGEDVLDKRSIYRLARDRSKQWLSRQNCPCGWVPGGTAGRWKMEPKRPFLARAAGCRDMAAHGALGDGAAPAYSALTSTSRFQLCGHYHHQRKVASAQRRIRDSGSSSN